VVEKGAIAGVGASDGNWGCTSVCVRGIHQGAC